MTLRQVRITVLIILLVVTSSLLPIPHTLQNKLVWHESSAKLRVLFIGNSFTFGNDLPLLLEAMMWKTSLPIDTEMIAYGGVSLKWHSNNDATLEALETDHWDYVVLQDCSDCPLWRQDAFQSGVREMVRLVKKAGSEPILFMTWADIGAFEQQKIIANEYHIIGKELDVKVVPVGLAWEAVQRTHPELRLYDGDGHHAGMLGTFVSAYTFITVLQKRPDHVLNGAVVPPPQRFYQLLFPEEQRIYADHVTAKKIQSVVDDLSELLKRRD